MPPAASDGAVPCSPPLPGATSPRPVSPESAAEEVLCCDNSGATHFEQCVGVLEDTVVGDDFVGAQSDFMGRHCELFEPTGECQLACTQIHCEFIEVMERVLISRLQSGVPGFSAEGFFEELQRKGPDAVDGPLWDLLNSLTDFATFRQLMVDFRQQRGGGGRCDAAAPAAPAAAAAAAAGGMPDLGGLCISGQSARR
eukprot:TRINITY_DN16862_c2_g1_i1.p3 TRINITY_DN16862_c2_g1~~TRINITY_DN16862_c2_g1_i1.p3  ORF type:complete len:198 (+),score=76.51 TRINITY_DN16862_c2_g1_i1:88-681(+)